MHHLESAQHQEEEEEKVPLLVVILSFDLIHENFFFLSAPCSGAYIYFYLKKEIKEILPQSRNNITLSTKKVGGLIYKSGERKSTCYSNEEILFIIITS